LRAAHDFPLEEAPQTIEHPAEVMKAVVHVGNAAWARRMCSAASSTCAGRVRSSRARRAVSARRSQRCSRTAARASRSPTSTSSISRR